MATYDDWKLQTPPDYDELPDTHPDEPDEPSVGPDLGWRPVTSYGRAWEMLTEAERDEIRRQTRTDDTFLSVIDWKKGEHSK